MLAARVASSCCSTIGRIDRATSSPPIVSTSRHTAFVRVAAGIEGLVHISEISDQHVDSPESVLTVGDKVRVKVIEVDVPRRRISLSMRQVGGAMPKPATEIEEEAAEASTVETGVDAASPSSTQEEAPVPEIAPAEVAPDGGVGSGAAAPAPAEADVPSEPETADEEPAAPAAEAPSEEAAEEGEEDISLEAILEDLKRREGRSE